MKLRNILHFSLHFSNDINLFLDSVCGRVLRAPHGIIKSPNFPSPYPDYSDCVWFIILEKYSDNRIQFLAFDLPPKNETCINFVKIKEYGYGSYIYYGGSSIPSDFTWSYGKVYVVEFITGQNKHQNYGFLLKYRTYKSSIISIASDENADVTNLNEKGMYV